MVSVITLPFPPAILSGHNTGDIRTKARSIKRHRQWAAQVTKGAGWKRLGLEDIHIHVRFVRPDRRSDRVNLPNRMKPYFDGIADAMGVNDIRFVPHFHFDAEPEAPGRVEVWLDD